MISVKGDATELLAVAQETRCTVRELDYQARQAEKGAACECDQCGLLQHTQS